MNTEDKEFQCTAEQRDSFNTGTSDLSPGLADRWIISRFQHTVSIVHRAMDEYRFDIISQAIYDFFWNEYCDWYLELSKPLLWDENANPEQALATRMTLLTILESSLRLTHPLMPYITEEIWQRVAPLLSIEGPSVMLQPYPAADEKHIDIEAESDIDWVKGIIVGIRNIRGEMDIPPGRAIPVLLRHGDAEDRRRLEQNSQYLIKLAKLDSIELIAATEEPPVSATQLYRQLEILVPLEGLIDMQAEQGRLEKEIARHEKGLEAVSKKLNNPKFVDNAPEAVVAKEREKQEAALSAINSLRERLTILSRLSRGPTA